MAGKHQASSTTINSAFIKFHYTNFQSYQDADWNQPSMEAGTALIIFMQIYLCFDNVPYFN